MARLTDPDTLARYKQALTEWEVKGAIVLEGRRAHGGLRTTLEGMTVAEFKEALYRFVCHENGEIDQVKEEREGWCEQWEWHYDLRLTINGVKVYVETRLHPESFASREDPTVLVVQIKPV
jgi:hypothetical protein